MDASHVEGDNAVGRQPKRSTSDAVNKVKKASRSKRTLVSAACEECRVRKARCDGGRPQCLRCSRGRKACIYSVNPGETRQAAAKTKTEGLQKDYDSIVEVLDTLRSKTLPDAQCLLDRLRASQDVSSFIKTFKDSRNSRDSEMRTSSITGSSNRSSVSEQRRVSSSAVSCRSSVTSPGWDDLPRTGGWRSDSTFVQRLRQSGLELPSESVLRKAVNHFYVSSGKIFQVFDSQLIDSYLGKLFGTKDQDASRRILCEVCCVAAVGVLYLKDPCEEQDVLYNIARVLLDDVIQERPLEAVKCCALLGLYNIMSKANVALAYIELGMDLSRRHRVHATTAHCPYRLSRTDCIEGKKAWRTLLFLGSWLSSTLGYITSSDWMLTGTTYKDIEIGVDTHIEDIVSTEMVKIGILTQAIVRISASSEHPDDSLVETVRHDLHQWHQNLPDAMRLTNLLNRPNIPVDARISIYNVHLLYLGALMLIYRQVLNSSQHSADVSEQDIEQAYVEAFTAAKQSSRFLNLLLQDNGVHQRCWLSIFQSYCAGVLILHGISQRLMQSSGQDVVAVASEDLGQASTCIDVLRYCGEVDPVATNFYGLLQPYYETLSTFAASSPLCHIPDSKLRSISAELFNLARKPFGEFGEQAGFMGCSGLRGNEITCQSIEAFDSLCSDQEMVDAMKSEDVLEPL